jgi:hypothetical protein
MKLFPERSGVGLRKCCVYPVYCIEREIRTGRDKIQHPGEIGEDKVRGKLVREAKEMYDLSP